MKESITTQLSVHNELEKQIGLVDASGKYDFSGFKRYENVIKHIKGEIAELPEKDKRMIEDDQKVLREISKIQEEITEMIKKEA